MEAEVEKTHIRIVSDLLIREYGCPAALETRGVVFGVYEIRLKWYAAVYVYIIEKKFRNFIRLIRHSIKV